MGEKPIADELADSARYLIEQPIMLRDYAGKPARPVSALLVGDYAIHRCLSVDGWSVTHVRSGAGAPRVDTPIEALIFLGIILGAGAHRDLDETYMGGKGLVDPETKARISTALLLLRSWDLDLDYHEPEDYT